MEESVAARAFVWLRLVSSAVPLRTSEDVQWTLGGVAHKQGHLTCPVAPDAPLITCAHPEESSSRAHGPRRRGSVKQRAEFIEACLSADSVHLGMSIPLSAPRILFLRFLKPPLRRVHEERGGCGSGDADLDEVQRWTAERKVALVMSVDQEAPSCSHIQEEGTCPRE